jgi:hypothetical protein
MEGRLKDSVLDFDALSKDVMGGFLIVIHIEKFHNRLIYKADIKNIFKNKFSNIN